MLNRPTGACGCAGAVAGLAELLVGRAREETWRLREGGLLTGLMRHVLQTGLEVEMAEHLGYEPHDSAGRGSDDSRKRQTLVGDPQDGVGHPT
jgi:transposase-like protein